MPGIGATTDDCSVAGPPWRWAAVVDVRRRRGRGRGQVEPERAAPRAAPARRTGGRESGGWSTRNAVVVSPARSAGCATSQRRNGRFVVTPSTSVVGERGREPVERLVARRGVRDQLRDHRVVRGADLVALLDAGVDADRRPAAGAARSGRPAGGTCADPRRRAAPRPRARAACERQQRRAARRARSRICHSTRSRPVTASVTGCSTWMRPFSSRKWKSRPSSTNSAVPAPT